MFYGKHFLIIQKKYNEITPQAIYNSVGGDFIVYKTPYQLLIEAGITELPVQVSKICSQFGWVLASYDSAQDIISALDLSRLAADTDGFCLKNKNYYILYNRKLSAQRQRFVIAHEIGHIMLGHVERMQCTTANFPPVWDCAPDELAANLYAARLVAPAPVLHALHATTPERIANVCGLTETAAAFCANYSASDNALLSSFESYIRRIFRQQRR